MDRATQIPVCSPYSLVFAMSIFSVDRAKPFRQTAYSSGVINQG